MEFLHVCRSSPPEFQRHCGLLSEEPLAAPTEGVPNGTVVLYAQSMAGEETYRPSSKWPKRSEKSRAISPPAGRNLQVRSLLYQFSDHQDGPGIQDLEGQRGRPRFSTSAKRAVLPIPRVHDGTGTLTCTPKRATIAGVATGSARPTFPAGNERKLRRRGVDWR